MSYMGQALLAQDQQFNMRYYQCLNEQALVFRNDGRVEFADLANKVLVGDSTAMGVWNRVLPVSPGFAPDPPANGPNPAESITISDGDILAAVQAQWPTVAEIVANQPTEPVNP